MAAAVSVAAMWNSLFLETECRPASSVQILARKLEIAT